MSSIYIQYHKTKIGELILGSFENKLCLLDFKYRRMRSTVDNRITKELNTKYLEKDNDVLAETKKQINEYLNGTRIKFDVPILMVGSDFQRQVWNELLKVKYGETATYLDISKRIDNPKAVRAAASANGANAIALIVPCHRIIESNGGLGGFGGGLTVKKRLLNIEIKNTILNDEEKYEFIGQKSTKHNHRFITAVKTTGIYCLPSCSARKPNFKNIIFYKTKNEAVKNGFRACKVCKP
jgi:methylated-DNA-[protein]-cysteine S-methyltransferase